MTWILHVYSWKFTFLTSANSESLRVACALLEQTKCMAWQASHSSSRWSTENWSQWFFWWGRRTPVPRQSGQMLPKAARTACLMNSDRLGMPFIAFLRDSGTLNVIISCFWFFIRPRLGNSLMSWIKIIPCNTYTSRMSLMFKNGSLFHGFTWQFIFYFILVKYKT